MRCSEPGESVAVFNPNKGSVPSIDTFACFRGFLTRLHHPLFTWSAIRCQVVGRGDDGGRRNGPRLATAATADHTNDSA